MNGIDIGGLFLTLGLDAQSYEKSMAAIKSQVLSDAAHLERSLQLSPKVDHSELTKLNQHLDSKEKHFKSVNQYMAQNPLKPKVDVSEVNAAINTIKDLRREASSPIAAKVSASKESSSQSSKQKVEVDSTGLSDSIAKEISKGFKSAQSGGGIASLLTAPLKVASSAVQSIFFGVFQGLGNELSRDIGKGLKDGIERELGDLIGSFSLVGKELGKGLAGEFVDVFSDEVAKARSVMEGVLGKENIVRESAGVRASQGKEARQSKTAAQEQIYSEYQFVEQNRGAIKERVQKVQGQYGSLAEAQQIQRDRIQETADKSGGSALKGRLNANNDRVKDLQSKITPDSTPLEIEAISQQIQRISENSRSLSEGIATIQREAARRYQGDADKLAHLKERIDKDARGLEPLIATPERMNIIGMPDRAVRENFNRQKQSQPGVYQNIAQQVADLSGVQMSQAQTPLLKVNKEFQGNQGLYVPDQNTIQVSQEVAKAVAAGKLTAEQVEILMHELRHSMQLAFGQIKGENAQSAVPLIKPTGKEARELGAHIESSVALGGGYSDKTARSLESDAYLFASRNAATVQQGLAKQQAIAGLESAIGVGGGKAQLNLQRAQMSGSEKIQKYAGVSSTDIQSELDASLAKVEKIPQVISQYLGKLDNLDLMGADEIEALQKQIVKAVELGVNSIVAETDRFKQQVVSKPDQIRSQLRDNLPTLNRKKELEPLARDFGIDPTGMKKGQLVEALAGSQDLQGLNDKVMGITRDRAQRRLQRREQMQSIAEGAGQGAGFVAGVGQNVANGMGAIAASPASQAMIQSGQQSIKALATVASAGYGLAKGLESLALDIIPMGRTLKGIGQQFVLPAATFGIASHMLPGGGAIAEGMNTLAQGGMAPLAHGAGDFLSGQAGGFLSNALPQAFGIQQSITGAVTGAIADAASMGGGMLAQGLAAVTGGKAIQAVASRAIAPALAPLNVPLALPPQRERELIALPEPKAKQKALSMGVSSSAPLPLLSSAMTVGKLSSEAPKALNLIQQSADWGKVDAADIEKAKSVGKYFSGAYKDLKAALKKGAAASAGDVSVFVKSANQAVRDIDGIIASMKDQGVNTDLATQLGGTLQGLKGQIARKRNEAERSIKVMSAKEVQSSIPTIDTTVSESEGSGLYGIGDVNEAIRKIRRRARKPIATGDAFENAEGYRGRAESSAARFESVEQKIYSREASANVGAASAGANSETLMSRVKRIFAANADSFSWIPQTTGMVKGLMGAFGAFAAIGFIAPMLAGIANECLDAARAFSNLKTAMNFASGSEGKAGDDLKFVEQTVSDLKVPLASAREGFKSFSASTKDTVLEGKATRDVFLGLQQASTTLGFSAEQTSGTLLAFSQIASKGRVSTEELNQAAERIPGFFRIAADSMGMTQGELRKLIESGNLLAEDFLPKLGQQMQSEFGGGAKAASQNAQSAMYDFQNSVLKTQEMFGKFLQPAQMAGFQVATVAVQGFMAVLNNLTPIIALVGSVIASNLLGSILNASISIAGLSGVLAGLAPIASTVFAAILSGAQAFMGQILKIAPQFLLIQAAIELTRTAFELFNPSESGKKFDGFANEAVAGLKRIEDAADAAAGKVAKAVAPTELKSKGFDLTLGLGGMTGLGALKSDDVLNFARNKIPGVEAYRNKMSEMTGGAFTPFTTVAEQKFGEEKVSLGNQAIAAQSIVGKVYDAGAINKQIAAVKQLNDQIKEVELQRQKMGLDPNANKKEIENLDIQKRSLTQQRDKAASPIVEQNAQLNAALKNVKQSMEEIDRMGLPDDKAKELKAQLEPTLVLLEKAALQQDKWNKKLNEAAIIAANFKENWEKAGAAFEDAGKRSDVQLANSKTAISQQEASGQLTQGQAQSRRDIADQSGTGQKLNDLMATIAQRKQLLSAIGAESTLKGLGINENTGSAELKRKASKVTDPKSKEAIEATQELRDLQDQLPQLQAQLADSFASANRQIRDAKKSIDDFYRSISRQSEDILATVKSTQLETALIQAKTRIKGAMSGFQDTFVDQFGDAIVGLLADVAEMGKTSMDAMNQIRQNANGLTDTLRQGQELGRSMPGYGDAGANSPGGVVSGNFTKFKDVVVTSAVDASGEPGMDYVTEANNGNGGRGANVPSLTGGKIIEIKRDNRELGMGGERGYGNVAIVRTLDKVSGEFVDILYAHFDKLAVKVGDEVAVGSVLGTQGRTGSTSGAHTSVDFFGKDSNGATKASLAMRDRLANDLANGGTQLNSQVGSMPNPSNNIVSMNRGGGSGGGNTFTQQFLGIKSEADKAILAVTAITEGLSGNVQSQVDTAVAMGNRLQSGKYGSSIQGVVSAPGQFEAYSRFGLQNVNSRESAIAALNKNGYNGQSAIDEFYKGLNDPQVIANAVSHIKGSVDYRGESPQTRKEAGDYQRPGGDNFYIPGGANGSSISASQANQLMAKGQAALGGFKGSPMAPTTGMTQGSVQNAERYQALGQYGTSQISGATQQAIAANKASEQSILANAGAKRGEIQQRLETARNKAIFQFKQGVEDRGVTTTQGERQIEDLNLSVGDATPDRAFNKRIIEISRQQEDSLRTLKKDREKLTEEVAKARSLLDELPKMVSAGQISAEIANPIIESLKAGLPKLESDLTKVNTQEARILDAFDKQRKDEVDKFQREDAKRRLEAESRISESSGELSSLNIAKMQRTGDPLGAMNLQSESAIAGQVTSFKKAIAEITELKRLGQLTDAEFSKLKANIEGINGLKLEGIQNEFRKARKELMFSSQSQLFGSQSSLQESLIAQANLNGDTNSAEAMQKELAIAKVDVDYNAQIRSIDQAVESGQLLAETALKIKENLTAVSKVQLDNVKQQFNKVGQANQQVMSGIKGSTQSLLKDLFSGKGIDFKGFLDKIVDVGADALSKLVTDNLFGNLFGSKNKGKSAGEFAIPGVEGSGGIGTPMSPEMNAIAQGGQKFVGLTDQAGQIIISAGQQFSQAVNGGKFGMTGGGDMFSQFDNLGFSGATTPFSGFDSIGKFEGIGSSLFDSASKASFKIQEGVSVASDFLSNAGSGASTNLLGGLSQGLPGIIQGIGGLFSGGGSSGALGGVGNIISNLFGSVGGAASSVGGGGIGSIFSSAISMFGGGFKDGGFVPNFADGGFIDASPFKNGLNPLADAVRREGAGAIVGVMKRGEYVLTPNEAKRYFELGVDKIVGGKSVPNFADGGFVSNAPSINAPRSMGNNVSVNVPVTVSGGSDEGVDVNGFRKVMDGRIREVIAQESRPGGSLQRRR